jgi:histidine phosphotransferase ChpT
MGSQVDIHTLELLCSRLCHELISPVTAVANGVELLSDEPGDEMNGEIYDLLAKSAVQAAKRLQFYRVAYGVGGTDAPMSLDQVRTLAQDLLEDEKVELGWPADLTAELPRPLAKILLNLIVAGVEALPRGGAMQVGHENSGRHAVEIACTGTGARVRDETEIGLASDEAGDLTPRSVHAYFLKRLIADAGGQIDIDTPADDSVRFRVAVGGG